MRFSGKPKEHDEGDHADLIDLGVKTITPALLWQTEFSPMKLDDQHKTHLLQRINSLRARVADGVYHDMKARNMTEMVRKY